MEPASHPLEVDSVFLGSLDIPSPSTEQKADIKAAIVNHFTEVFNGYCQIPLHSSCQILTTFIIPWGRFKFLRVSMGLICTGDEYNRRPDMTFVDQVNTVRVVDDLLRFDRYFPVHVKGVCCLLYCGPEGRRHPQPGEVSVFSAKGIMGGIRDSTWWHHRRPQ